MCVRSASYLHVAVSQHASLLWLPREATPLSDYEYIHHTVIDIYTKIFNGLKIFTTLKYMDISKLKYFQIKSETSMEENELIAGATATVPAWKLQIIKNRKKNKSSASFSCYDRSPRPRTVSSEEPAGDGSAKTQDIIKFFNKSTDGARLNLSSSRSFRSGVRPQRHGWLAAGAGTIEESGELPVARPGPAGDSGAGASCRQPLSRVPAQPGSRVRTQIQRSASLSLAPAGHQDQDEDSQGSGTEDEDELSWGLETGSARGYLDTTGAVELLLGRRTDTMGEDTRLYVSNEAGGGAASRHTGAGGGVGARLYRGRNTRRHSTGRGGLESGDSDGMMGSGGESDSSEEIHYGPGFVSR